MGSEMCIRDSAEGVDRVEYDDGRPGLGEYDIAFATKDEEGAE